MFAIVKTINYLLLTILGLFFIFIISLQNSYITNIYVSILTNKIYDNTGFEVKINNVEINFPLIIKIPKIYIKKNSVNIAKCNNININIVSIANFSLKRINSIEIEKIHVLDYMLSTQKHNLKTANGEINHSNSKSYFLTILQILGINNINIANFLIDNHNTKQKIEGKLNLYNISCNLKNNVIELELESKIHKLHKVNNIELKSKIYYNDTIELFSINNLTFNSDKISFAGSANIKNYDDLSLNLEYHYNLYKPISGECFIHSSLKQQRIYPESTINIKTLIDDKNKLLLEIKSNLSLNNNLLYFTKFESKNILFQPISKIYLDINHQSLHGKIRIVDQDLKSILPDNKYSITGLLNLDLELLTTPNNRQQIILKGNIEKLKCYQNTIETNSAFIQLEKILEQISQKIIKSNPNIINYNPVKLSNKLNKPSNILNSSKINFDIKLDDVLTKSFSHIKIDTKYLKIKNKNIHNLTFNFLNKENKFHITSKAFSNGSQTYIKINGTTKNEKLIWIDTLNITMPGLRLNNEKMIEIIDHNEYWVINTNSISINRGSCNIQSKFSNNLIDLGIKFNQVRLSECKLSNTLNLSNARLQGSLYISNLKNQIRFSANLNCQNIQIKHLEKNIDLIGNFNMKDNKLNFVVQAQQENQTLLKLIADIPIQYSSNFDQISILNNPKKIFLSVTIDKNLRIISLIPMNENHQITGEIYGNFNIKGTMDRGKLVNSLVQGSINCDSISYRYLLHDISVHNLSAKIIGQNNTIIFKNITILDNTGNTAYGNGYIYLTNTMPFNIYIKTEKFYLINQYMLQIITSLDLELKGNLTGATIAGNINIQKDSQINLNKNYKSDFGTFNVIKTINDSNSDDKINNKSSANNHLTEIYKKILLQLKITLEKPLRLNGFGINTKLIGQLDVKGNLEQPELYGNLQSLDGEYLKYFKMFKIIQGGIKFNGKIPDSMDMYFTATSKLEDDEIHLDFYRSTHHNRITFSSVNNPSLNQTEILYLLLFGTKKEQSLGHNLNNILELSYNLNPLYGKKKNNIFYKITRIDNLRITNNKDDPDQTSIGLTKNINNRLFLEVVRLFKSGDTKTRIIFQVSPKISLEYENENLYRSHNFEIKISYHY
ncbi:translocation/assembly module TamB domain-containing protein [Rickettsia endosymbiont of Cardiosporidium cionae]|uniref:translocation/assembly module TamB domain-containing protein n=1 Tax=Rickettsia endosymbiont of Cardiosporidium cionae TaxID=2777155 RepID=UPI0018934D51|nr:translocation/assembly module TamB domain-containing protein [Rickettsia endosymbiont of Cardiosporidium cionae]KAF8819001.1 hypothetical protein IHI24_000238 [Rickettsia endosymbiont of Cardiosporidium cionae]